MIIDFRYSAAALIIVAAVTGLTRAIPYLLFGKKGKLPTTIHYLGTVLPGSIMIILVIYCVRKINLTIFPFGLPELLSIAVVVVTQILKKNTFFSILLGTACYMILIRITFTT